MTDSPIAHQAIADGVATGVELEDVASGFHDWSRHPDSWFTVLHGEIIATA